MDAAVAALLGAAIGAAGSFGATWLQMRQQHKREMMRMSVDLAMHDFTENMALVKQQGGGIAPLVGYLIYHQRVLKEAEKGPITKDVLEKIGAEFLEASKAMRRSDRAAASSE
jgi:hypothetical protein